MNEKPELVKQTLFSFIDDMEKHHWLFSCNPGHDFMRQDQGKLTFSDTMKLIIGMGKSNTTDEIIDFFDMDPDLIPSNSAFVQRRGQISLSAFEYLFQEFSSAFPQITKPFKGKAILAFDGTHIVYTTNSEIIEDYNKPRLEDYKGYNHMHLNGFADVNSKAFLDVIIQPGQQPDERDAMHQMLDHFDPIDPENYIITADRGYESYDMIFHCELRGFPYVFRVKSPSSPKSILSTFIKELPDHLEEFDVKIKRFFTDKYNKVMKEQTQIYHYMNPGKNAPHFKPLLGDQHLVYLKFRVVKLKSTDNCYEYIITNLPPSFDIEDIREAYQSRWNEELCFRYLKHAAGLLYFHSRKPEFVKQEIFATLVMYNFGVFLANEALHEHNKKKQDPDNKYKYTIDFSTAIRTARKYYRRSAKEPPIDVIRLLCKYFHAVKERFRKFKRPLRGIGAIRFCYR